MLFNSVDFLIFFLIFIFPYYFLYGSKWQRRFLLVMSFAFYSYWHLSYALILIFSIVVDFFIGKMIYSSFSKTQKKLLIVLSISVNMGMLSYFKYADFLRGTLFKAFEYFHLPPFGLDHPFGILLPIGVSFYIFQTLSYTIDVYRGRIKPCMNLADFALFVTFFPQLVAGPILRFEEFEGFSKEPWAKADRNEFMIGAGYVALGIWKKVIISDNIAWWNNQLFGNFTMGTPGLLFWIGAAIFGIQIYCDFSGYSDIAIGLGRICGIKLPDNFNNPYSSRNISEFWSRWHITLSRWLKDYLYIPLGGNRKGSVRTYVNLMITMLLGGLWHGASWNFVIWGGIQGVGLAVHKAYTKSFLKRLFDKIPFYGVFTWIVTLFFVSLSWLAFRITNTEGLIVAYRRIFDFTHLGSLVDLRGSQIKAIIPFVLIFFLYEVVISRFTKEELCRKISSCSAGSLCIISFVYGFFLMCFLPGQKTPFIYFQF